MSQKSSIWSVVWQVVEFILTLGLSHIARRKKRIEDSTEDGGALTDSDK